MRFSIRALLVLIFAAALVSSYVASQEAKRRQLIRDIERVGGQVETDRFANVTGVTLPHASLIEIQGARLKLLPKLAKLTLLDVEGTSGDLHFEAKRIEITTVTDELLDELGH